MLQRVLHSYKNMVLEEHFKFNIEANHATLLVIHLNMNYVYARINGMLGSVDANQGDPLLAGIQMNSRLDLIFYNFSNV